MPTTSRAATTARTELLDQLKQDHQSVKKAYKQFQKLDPQENAEECEAIVQQVLAELSVHMAIEEELLYPAAREAMGEEEIDLIDEAEIEHESAHTLMEQLEGMSPDEDKYAARFTVLCEYVLHHVKEEEGELFPALEKAKLDWQDLSARATERRAEMEPEDGADEGEESAEEGAGEGAGERVEAMAEEGGGSDDADSPRMPAGRSGSGRSGAANPPASTNRRGSGGSR